VVQRRVGVEAEGFSELRIEKIQNSDLTFNSGGGLMRERLGSVGGDRVDGDGLRAERRSPNRERDPPHPPRAVIPASSSRTSAKNLDQALRRGTNSRNSPASAVAPAPEAITNALAGWAGAVV